MEVLYGQYQEKWSALRFLEASWGRLGAPWEDVLEPLGAILAILAALGLVLGTSLLLSWVIRMLLSHQAVGSLSLVLVLYLPLLVFHWCSVGRLAPRIVQVQSGFHVKVTPYLGSHPSDLRDLGMFLQFLVTAVA